eukprot:TRINITY_DN23844_c0_g1_i2.p1 TRINITY_DN23844_c0_g1~~TRINITY_DN23844_c0_g1_i2.p1  ORF type:complete len:980 (+),score=195.66 TRINITY_DN23844_c0_g1_i2:1-2940(+)
MDGTRGQALHALSTSPLAIWTIEDPMASTEAGRCAVLPLGPGADWALSMSSSQEGDKGVSKMVVVNGREVVLGCPQLVCVPGLGALLLHSPLDMLAPQILVERAQDQDMRAQALHAPPLQHAANTRKLRPPVEECFVAVPHVDRHLVETREQEGPGDMSAASSVQIAGEAGIGMGGEFAAENSVLFFQPSRRRVVQLDVARKRTREIWLDNLAPAPFQDGKRSVQPFSAPMVTAASATATSFGVELVLSCLWQSGEPTNRFLSLHFPTASGPTASAGLPKARWVEARPAAASPEAASSVTVPLPAALAAGPGPGLVAVPFGTEGSTCFAAVDRRDAEDPDVPLGNLLDGQRDSAGARVIWSLHAKAQTSRRSGAATKPGIPWPASLTELESASDGELKALVAEPAPELPLPRNLWRSRDILVTDSSELLLRALRPHDGSVADWLEFAHLPSQTLRRLPAWPQEAEEGKRPAEATATRGASCCVVVFRSGHVRWLEACPDSLAQSLQDHFQLRGLRGLMEQAQEEEAEDEQEDEEDDEDSDATAPQGSEASGGAAQPGRGRARPGRAGGGSPAEAQRLRRRVLKRALQQRRRQREEQANDGPRTEKNRTGPLKEVSGKPKHGDEDDKEHIGGNRWAGGSGGADTAGLGGRGGPYRLEKRGQSVHQVSDEAKAEVSKEAQEAARRLAKEALERRLEEINLSGGDYSFYASILDAVRAEVERLRAVLSGAASRQKERHWRRGLEGELDEGRLVDALAGEAAVFRRRAEREPRPGEPPLLPKRALFLFDASASMYRFNGTDGRLRRSCETAVMIMEALCGLETRFDYALCCHDGDHVLQELVPFGRPPADEKERLAVISKLVAASQYCSSGDHTLPAIEAARLKVAEAGPADDRFVFAFSDANFERYGLTAESLGKALGATEGSKNQDVRSLLLLLATFEDEALAMAQHLPDQVRLCLDPRELPSQLRQEFASRVMRRSVSSL